MAESIAVAKQGPGNGGLAGTSPGAEEVVRGLRGGLMVLAALVGLGGAARRAPTSTRPA